MWSEVVTLFEGFGTIPMIIMLAGILLCIVEVFVPGFGVFGITGLTLSIGGIVARMIMGATLNQFLIMLLSSVSLVVLAILIMLISARAGAIRRSPLIESKTSISVNYGSDDKKLLKMLGKVTFATTEFKPSGKFDYNGETYEGRTNGEFISKGEKIQIVEIQADKIIVKSANGINGKTK
ncbi:MAG: hypothetical protein IKB42_01330 [Clostridia bacterium]|nr:hypothetical protein [Clostridia bacterium]